MTPKEKAAKGLLRYHGNVRGEDNDWSPNDMDRKEKEADVTLDEI